MEELNVEILIKEFGLSESDAGQIFDGICSYYMEKNKEESDSSSDIKDDESDGIYTPSTKNQ